MGEFLQDGVQTNGGWVISDSMRFMVTLKGSLYGAGDDGGRGEIGCFGDFCPAGMV